jgi:hypothetical protein
MRILFPNNMPNDPAEYERRSVLYAVSRGIPLAHMAKHTGMRLGELINVKNSLRKHGIVKIINGEASVGYGEGGAYDLRRHAIFHSERNMAVYDAVLERLDPSIARVDDIRFYDHTDQDSFYGKPKHIMAWRFELRPLKDKPHIYFNSRSRYCSVGPPESTLPVNEAADHIVESINWMAK